MVTNGGRVLGVTGLGDDIPKAIERTYQAVQKDLVGWQSIIEPISGQKA